MTTLAVTVNNRVNNGTDTGGSTVNGTGGATANSPRLGWVRRWHHVIGSGSVDKIRFAYDNWFGNASSNTVDNVGNAHTITAGSVEFNGIIVPILFSGNRSITLNDGDGKILSDWIYPAQLGVSQFNRGDTIWTKEHGTVPAANGKMPNTARYTQDLTGCQFSWYAADQSTISSVDATGVFTATGVAFLTRTAGPCPIVLGTFVGGDKPVRMVNGDSIPQGWGQTTGHKMGRGYWQRAQVDADGTSNPVASLNFAVYASSSGLGVQDPRILAYHDNANSLLIAYGTNDFTITGTATTPSALLAKINAIKTAAIAKGITRIAVQQLGVRAASSDSLWATEATQTPSGNWISGGQPDLYNQSLATAGFTMVFPNNSCRGTNPFVWLTNGTTKYTAFDEVHPSGTGHDLKAAEIRPLLAQLDPQAADTVPDAFSFTAQTSVALNSPITSNTVTLAGTDADAAISIVGGTYQIAGGTFTSANGTISPGQTFAVKITSSATNNTPASAVLTIGGVSATFTATTLAGVNDTVPDAFTFTPATNVALSSTQTSNTITIAGINAAATITVSGGSYSIAGGAFTTASGTITNGQTVAVRGVASGVNATESTVTLTIGGVPGYYNIATIAAASDITPDSFSFTPATGVAVNTLSTSSATTISGINASTPVSITGGEYSIDGGAFTAADGTITNGQAIAVRRTSSSSGFSTVTATLTIGGVSADYSVTTAAVAPPDTTPATFSFNAATGAPTSTLSTSNTITVSGIDTAAPISVSGGEYKIGSGNWVTANGTVSNGESVSVRRLSSSVNSTTVSVILNIGGVSGAFTITTAAESVDTTAIVATSLRGIGSKYVNTVTLGETGALSFNPSRQPVLLLINNTGSDLAPTITGSGSHSIEIKTVGVISLEDGYQLDPIPSGGTAVVPLASISSYLRGVVTISGGTGLKAALLES